MAIRWLCTLDAIVLDNEPINMSTIEISIIRDDSLHGIGAEASTDPLEFTGNGAAYLSEVMELQGLKANVVFKAQKSCGEDEPFETIFEGKLNFSDFKEKCGNICSVVTPMETVSCETIMKSRYDQSVDMDKAICFDGMTALDSYEDLNFPVSLPTRILDYRSEGQVDTDGDLEEFNFPSPGGGSEAYVMVRPEYVSTTENINDTHLSGANFIGYSGPNGLFIPVSNQVLFNENNSKCFSEPIYVTARLKGSVIIPGVTNLDVYAVVLRGELNSLWPINDPTSQQIQQITLGTNIDANTPFAFDFTMTPYNWIPNDNGADGIYVYIALHQHPGANFVGSVTFDTESFFSAVTVKSCPPTVSPGYMVHETLSRTVEAITNNCAKVKSSYYGRTDSQPYAFEVDGCGGKRMFTSGLKMRNALNAKFAASLKDLIEGLQCIDNIGMALEINTGLGGGYLLRIEDLDFFYRDQEILRCPFIPDGEFDIEPSKFYSTIKMGYKKWQTQANFGLDEYNSDREYRTSLTSIANILDKTSAIVVGEYSIEVTREQQYADSNSADTSYDDEIFLICMERNGIYGYAYGGLIVEQGGINFATNIFSPASTYNYRLSPARNLMRWARTILASYPNISDSDNIIYFSKGTGNTLASGQLADSYLNDCVLEGLPIAENQNITPLQFKDPVKATPLWRNKTFTFNYPMSISDYNRIKLNPYGYVSFQCGTGEWQKGFIKELKYRPVQGDATIILRLKWSN